MTYEQWRSRGIFERLFEFFSFPIKSSYSFHLATVLTLPPKNANLHGVTCGFDLTSRTEAYGYTEGSFKANSRSYTPPHGAEGDSVQLALGGFIPNPALGLAE